MDRGTGRSAYFRRGWKAKAFSKKKGRGDDSTSKKGNRGSHQGNGPSSSDASSSNKSYSDLNDETVPHNIIQKRTGRRPRTIDCALFSQMEKKYPGFTLYFPSSPEISDLGLKIEAATEYLIRNRCQTRSCILDIEELEFFDEPYDKINDDETFKKSWPDFSADFDTNPEHVFKIFGLAMHTVKSPQSKLTQSKLYMYGYDNNSASEVDVDELVDSVDVSFKKEEINLPYIRCGIMKAEPTTALRSIKVPLLGKFVTVRGVVVRMGMSKLQCTRLTFRCGDSFKEFWVEQPEGLYTPPNKCGASEYCENTAKDNFDPVPNASTTKVIEFRRIRIQDVDHRRLEHGKIPKTIDCDLYYDMVNRCGAADVVTVCGIVRLSSEGTDKSLHSLYIEAFAMRNNNEMDRSIGGGGWCSYSDADHQLIRDIFDTKNLFGYLVASLCPSIYGHQHVKAGILLALFGGTQQKENIMSCRPDINILMVGDPGLGKSQMLKIVSQVAPRDSSTSVSFQA